MAQQKRGVAKRDQAGPPAEEGNGQDSRPTTALEPFLAQMQPASQATSVEWVRAAAEVRAAVMVARDFPRSVDTAVAELRRSCAQVEMAKRAFYTYKRGGKTITGPTVQLAREAMRCWGNFQAGMWELDRRPGWSEMMAWAWDLQSNARFASTFRVMHVRERGEEKGGAYVLGEDEVRDIYELNTNMAARRLREQIKAALPAWFMAIAEGACKETINGPPGEFDERVDACVKVFAARLKVTEAALVRKLAAPRDVWTPNDLLTLRVLYEALLSGEVRVADEFPDLAPRGGAADTLAKAAKGKEPPADPPAGDDNPDPASATAEGRQADIRAISALFTEHGWGGRTAAHSAVRRGMVILALRWAGLPDPGALASLDGLTAEQAAEALVRLRGFAADIAAKDGGEAVHAAMGREVQNAVDTVGLGQAGGE
jgi:hypothetical protein